MESDRITGRHVSGDGIMRHDTHPPVPGLRHHIAIDIKKRYNNIPVFTGLTNGKPDENPGTACEFTITQEHNQMTKKIYDTAIIGAGASGLVAAIAAARHGARTILLEHMDTPAKKLPATGNGRCNYTNASQMPQNYYCDEPDFVKTVLTQFSYADTIRFFKELGIRPVQKNGTCIYPESGQAASVRNALIEEIRRLDIPLVLSARIHSIHKEQPLAQSAQRQAGTRTIQKDCFIRDNFIRDCFIIETDMRKIYSRTCILAAGGKAAPKTGSDGSGYTFAAQAGHRIVTPLPALTALTAGASRLKLPAGVRISCRASLYVNGEHKATEQGELQITEYGLSGIVIFQLSRFASRALAARKKVRVLLDFKPDMSATELTAYLDHLVHSVFHAHKSLRLCLNGFLPEKLIPVLLKKAGLAQDGRGGLCDGRQLETLADTLKNYDVTITDTKGFDAAQVTTGGVCVSEIDPHTMESKIMRGLYFCGEIVDADAKCGGYNLQWAWSGGYTAGKNSAAYCLETSDTYHSQTAGKRGL